MKSLPPLFLCFAIALAVSAHSQSFTTRAEALTIGKKDAVQVEYVADNVSIEQFTLPKFTNWMVVSGPDESSSTLVINNSLKQNTTYTLILQPLTTGKIVVPGATAHINNKPKTSNPLVIEVKNADHLLSSVNPSSQAPPTSLLDLFPMQDDLPSGQFLKKGESAINKIKNNIVVRLELSKTNCFVGEPILATYKLCTRLKSTSKVIKQPMFSGCTVVELTDSEMSSHVEKINGWEYNVFVIRRVQLIPLNAGSLTLPQAQVENKVSFYDASKINYRDLFYDNSRVPIESQTVTLSNQPQTIQVKPLPPSPAGFSGAIGSFNISISAANQNFNTANTNNLIISVAGVGNLRNMKWLPILWPQALEGFEPQENIEYDKTSLPVQVAKNITYPFTADKKGTYIIPPVQFIYFDPSHEKYISKATSSFAIQILPGNKKVVKLPSFTTVTSLQNPLYIIIGICILALLIAVFWFNARKKSKDDQPKDIQKEIIANEVMQPTPGEDYLFQLRQLNPYADEASFYKNLSKNLHSFLKEKYRLEPTQIPDYSIQHPQSADALQQLKELTDKCNLVMYTPFFELDEAMQDRLKAIEVIMNLQRE